jgi:hypothetical protein
MKYFPAVFLGLMLSSPLPAQEAQPPLIPQQADGLIVLNPQAAAFVMTDKLGRHVMNASDPRLRIEGGKIVNPGERFQMPAWRFAVRKPGKFDVFLDADTRRSERCTLRLSFILDGKEGRVVGEIPRQGNDRELIWMGQTGLSAGELEARLLVWGADHPNRLPGIGNIFLVPVDSELAAAFAELLKSTAAQSAEALVLQENVEAVEAELRELRSGWKEKPEMGRFRDYAEVMEWDRAATRIPALESELLELLPRLHQARLTALAAARDSLQDSDRQTLDAVTTRSQSLRHRAAALELPVFAAQRTGSAPLFPTGNLAQLASGPSSEANVMGFAVPAPDDAAARRAAFAARNSPEALAALCRRLHAALRPDVKGLEDFYREFAEGRYAEALDAYRDYFFRKLKNPDRYGASGVNWVDDFFQTNGKAMILRPPNAQALAANLEGAAVLLQNKDLWKGEVGEPGTVNWAPADLEPPDGALYERGGDSNPFWKTPDGRLLAGRIEFFRRLNRQPGQGGPSALFYDLLASYAFTGNQEHLALYAAYLDDWAMNSLADVENCPVNIRAATELEVIGWYRTLLRMILDERPEFAMDFPAPALARLVLALTEQYHPYIIRAKRAEIANWGIMGVEGALNDSRLFHEFRSMQYSNRELSRLARMNFLQHLSLDGENLESWDEGHVAIDGMLEGAPALSLHGAPVMGDLEAASLMDHARTMQRTLLTHFSPDGNYWVPWLSEDDSHRATVRGKIIPRALVEDILDEPEARRRFLASQQRIPDDGEILSSDLQPYAQMAYLRDGFGADKTSLVFQNFPARSQNQGWTYNGKRGHLIGSMRTQFSVARDGKSVLEATPILVDSKPPNRFTDMVRTGGKTDFAFATPRNVQAGKFLSSERFDVLEGIQDAPYRRFDFEYREILGLKGTVEDEPIRDVRATRQIIHLRKEGVFVIGDRITSPAEEREFSQMFVVPLRVGSPGGLDRLRLLADREAPLLEINPEAASVRSLSPGLPNVSLYLAGHDFTWGGRCTGENRFDSVESVSAKEFLELAKANKDPERVLAEQRIKIVSAHWTGTGNQALAAAVFARPAEPDPALVGKSDLTGVTALNGPRGVSGLTFKTPDGTEVWYQIAPGDSAPLSAGPGSARAGSLLVTRKNGLLAGVVMGAEAVVLNGRSCRGPAPSFAFDLTADGAFQAEAVAAPIDTVVIEPQQTVFTDKVDVSFGIPTQDRNDLEFRYTQDGSDPTRESALYEGPFEIREDTRVKVRAFRKGLKETPWNIAGTEAGKTTSAIFRKVPSHPAADLPLSALRLGLTYEYFEDSWLRLLSHSGMYPMLSAKASGLADRLLDPKQLDSLRATDRAFAVKYEGYIEVPESGVYRFFAPDPLYQTTKDAGFELRIWIDGEEWFPNPDLHAENIWSVALDKGLHRFQVSYVDYRWKKFRNEYWMTWNPGQMAEGVPMLELDGPGLARQPLPSAWLRNRRPE